MFVIIQFFADRQKELSMANAVSTVTFVAYLLGSVAHHDVPSFRLHSEAIDREGILPTVYTCHGKNRLMPLHWHGEPIGTRSYVLVMRDNDSPEQRYSWELYNIPPDTNHLAFNQLKLSHFERFALNSKRHDHYDGPCLGAGQHHYQITLYAIDTRFNFQHQVPAEELLKAIQGHILARTSLRFVAS